MRNLKNKEQVEATREANATAVVAYGLAGRGASSRRLSEEDESTVDIDQPPGLAKRPRPASAGAGFEALAGKLIDLNADSNTIRARLAQTDEQRLALAEKKHDDDKTERARLAAEQKEERERHAAEKKEERERRAAEQKEERDRAQAEADRKYADDKAEREAARAGRKQERADNKEMQQAAIAAQQASCIGATRASSRRSAGATASSKGEGRSENREKRTLAFSPNILASFSHIADFQIEARKGKAKNGFHTPEYAMRTIAEGAARLHDAPGVFYNKDGVLQRDLTVLALRVCLRETAGPRTVLDAMSGSGVRALRYALEIPRVALVVANDSSALAAEQIGENAALSGGVGPDRPSPLAELQLDAGRHRARHRGRQSALPVRRPIAREMSSARAPPTSTRMAARRCGAPPSRAPVGRPDRAGASVEDRARRGALHGH